MTFPDFLNLVSVLLLVAAAWSVWRARPPKRLRLHGHLFGAIFMGLAGFRLAAGLIIHPNGGGMLFSAVENLLTVAVIAAGFMMIHGSDRGVETQRQLVIQSQEQRLANIVNNLPDVFIRIDRHLRFVLVNDAAEKEFGMKPEEISGKSLLDFNLPPENIERVREIVVSVLETGHPRMDEVSLTLPEGTRHYITYGVPELSESDRAESALFILRNNTDKVQAIEAVRASQERFSRVVKANPMGMHFYNLEPDGRLVLIDYNTSADEILRVSHAGLVGKTIEEAFPGLIDTEVPSAYRRLALEGGHWHSEQINYNQGMISGAYEVNAFQIAQMQMVTAFTDITPQKQAEQMIQQQVEELELLRNVDQAIISTNDVRSCIEMLIPPIQQFFCADVVEVLLYQPENQSIHYIAGAGYINKDFQPCFPFSEGTPRLAINSRQTVYLKNIPQDPAMNRNTFYQMEQIISCYTVPLETPNRVQGVMQIFYRHETKLNPSKEAFLSTVAGQLAIAVEKSRLWDSLQETLEDLKQSYETSLETLVCALDLRDNETEHHTRRVTELSIATARALGIPDEQVDTIRRGALLHDVGKIGIPDRILYKAGPLTEAEWVIMRQHPVKAYQLLQKIELFHDTVDIPYCHHERWDGSGYPRGLRGEEIPLAARIFALADVWDALISDRPYRKRWTEEQAAAHIAAQAGVLFDPKVTEIFLSLVKKDRA